MNQASTYFFGKLPAYADYVAYQAEGPAAAAFERWVRGGMHLIGHSLLWDEVYRKAQGFHFVYPHAGQLLVGRLWSSMDRVGRKYPFWAGFNTYMNPGAVPQLLAQYPRYFDGIERSLEGGILHIKPEALLTLIPELRAPINSDMEYESFISKVTVEAFVMHMFGADAPVSLKSVFLYLTECLRPMASVAVSDFRLGLRLPLGKRNDQVTTDAYYIRAWLQLVSALAGPKQELTPYLYWGPEHGYKMNHLTLFFTPPPADIFPILLDPSREHDLVSDLPKGAAYVEKNRWSVPDGVQDLLHTGGLSLKQAFAQLHSFSGLNH